MILGVSSFTAGWAVGVEGHPVPRPWTEADLLDLAARWNLHGLQICDNLPVHSFNPERLEKLKEQTSSLRLEIGARGFTRERMRTYLDLALYLNASLIRFVVDEKGYEPTPSMIRSIAEEFVPELEKHNIILGIENHDRFTAKTLASLMESIGSLHVGICLDTANSLGAGEGLEYVAQTLAPFTVNLHIKDFTIQRAPHNMGFRITGTVAGKGMTDIPRLLDWIVPYERCPSAVLEVWTEPLPDIAKTLEKEARAVHDSFEYLTSLPVFYVSKNQQIL